VASVRARCLNGLPEVRSGADLGDLIVRAAAEQSPALALADEQIVVLAHKVISKAEGAVVPLQEVRPTRRALQLAGEQDKDPRVVQVVLDQSREILRAQRGVLISRTHHGFVCANAGVDTSNAVDGTVITLPVDPDSSARTLRERLTALTGSSPAVLITDSFGRAWRHGQCDVAIGCAGIEPLDDWRGRKDSSGMELRATWLAVADSIAATADLARAKDSREPVVIVEGLGHLVMRRDGPGAAGLLRAVDEDLFR
jgi:coenzyme F420-0:L-glutamate ligase/coenzyme F420-1:gamma-L-glutamate ligase